MERHPKPGSRELVKRLLRRELTCRAAKGELCLDDGIIRRTLECERVGFEEKVRFIHWLGSDIICLTPTYVGSPKQLFRPDESILAEVDLWIQKTDLFVFAILDGAFELGVRTFGFQSFLRQLQRTPSKVKMFVDRVEKNNKNAASQLAGHGIDGIIIADDIAYKDGLLFRPQAFNELFLPSLARQIECSSSKGVPVFFHSDGNYCPIIPSLIEVGFSGLHCIDKNCGMCPDALLHNYGDALCLWGHIDATDIELFRRQTESSGLHATLRHMKKSIADSRFILGTTSGLYPGMDTAGLKASLSWLS